MKLYIQVFQPIPDIIPPQKETTTGASFLIQATQVQQTWSAKCLSVVGLPPANFQEVHGGNTEQEALCAALTYILGQYPGSNFHITS